MKNRILLAGLILAVAMISVPVATFAKAPKYEGVKNCALCHRSKKAGGQYEIWQKSKHADSYKVLGTDKAKAAAKKVGVTTDPQKSDACLICHTTGHGDPASQFSARFKVEDGVQCEACHGPGEHYRKKSVMKKIYAERGADRKGKSPTAKKTGLIIPTEKDCLVCHSKTRKYKGKTYTNPEYKPFDFKTYWAKIKHPVPAGAK